MGKIKSKLELTMEVKGNICKELARIYEDPREAGLMLNKFGYAEVNNLNNLIKINISKYLTVNHLLDVIDEYYPGKFEILKNSKIKLKSNKKIKAA